MSTKSQFGGAPEWGFDLEVDLGSQPAGKNASGPDFSNLSAVIPAKHLPTASDRAERLRNDRGTVTWIFPGSRSLSS
ncbi:MAG: hypothetical protein DWI12_02355 [Planctomycetota bacterium]|nr:MAG: hypothetical protein DWI12_02355 [Planctomycetota bacterium]